MNIPVTLTEPAALADRVCRLLQDFKLTAVESIDLGGRSALTDYMIIATAASVRQAASAAARLDDSLAAAGVRASVSTAGAPDWVIVDAGDVIVHVMDASARERYQLERLYRAAAAAVAAE